MEGKLGRLVSFNLIMGFLHLIQGILMMVLATILPIRSSPISLDLTWKHYP